MPCLALLATAGDEPDWNDRDRSRGHRAIPLASERMVEELPMIAQLIRQLGLDVGSVLRPDPKLLVDMDQQQYNRRCRLRTCSPWPSAACPRCRAVSGCG